MESRYQGDHSYGNMLQFVRQHLGKMLLSFAAVIAATLAYLSLAPREFRSEAKIFVRLGREAMALDPTVTTGQHVAVADSRDSEVHAVEELLSSRLSAEKIVDQFGTAAILEKDPNKPGLRLSRRLAWLDPFNLNPFRVYSLRDKAIKACQKNLAISVGKKSNVVAVSYEAEDPQLAQEVLSSLLQIASDEHLRVHHASGSEAFFEKQCLLLRTNLAELEEKLRDLKDETGFAALATQRDIQLQLIGSLQTDMLRAQAERDAAAAEVELRQKQLLDLAPLVVTEQTTGLPQTARQTLREKLYELEVREQELASFLKEDAPLLAQLRRQNAEARKIMQDEQTATQVTKGINQAHQLADSALRERAAQLAAVVARTESFNGEIGVASEKLKQLNASEVQITRLEREIDLARTNYRKYADSLEQARIDGQLDAARISSLNLLQPPSFSETPVSPEPLPTLALGLVVAVLASFGVALAADRTRQIRIAPTATPVTVVREALAAPPISRARRNEIAPANPR